MNPIHTIALVRILLCDLSYYLFLCPTSDSTRASVSALKRPSLPTLLKDVENLHHSVSALAFRFWGGKNHFILPGALRRLLIETNTYYKCLLLRDVPSRQYSRVPHLAYHTNHSLLDLLTQPDEFGIYSIHVIFHVIGRCMPVNQTSHLLSHLRLHDSAHSKAKDASYHQTLPTRPNR
jgi:hypothetical protein